jgi:hypothetical protein
MPMMVHIADERNERRILASGLKIARGAKGLYCMPVTQEFTTTHQWVREMSRWNGKKQVGVYFKLKSSEPVLFGKYGNQHKDLILGQAIGKFLKMKDKLGYEFILKRSIEAKEIVRISKFLPKVGWRHMPNSHEGPPIFGPSTKELKAQKKHEKKHPKPRELTGIELVEKLKHETSEQNIIEMLKKLGSKVRRMDPEDLRFIITRNDSSIKYLAAALGSFKHRNAIAMLEELCIYPNEDVRFYSAQSIISLKKREAPEILKKFTDSIIANEMNEYLNNLKNKKQGNSFYEFD